MKRKLQVKYSEDYSWRRWVFDDRWDAGEKLADFLLQHGVKPDAIYAIPCGGVPVAYVVAKKLGVPMDVIVCRKLLIPWNREAGFGAMAPDGSYFVDKELVDALGLSSADIESAIEEQYEEVTRRLRVLRGDRPYRLMKCKTVMVVDDGIAAGYTMMCAARFLRDKLKACKVIAAAPTACADTLKKLKGIVDEVYVLNLRTGPVFAVADAYVNWRDMELDEVKQILDKARKEGLLLE